MALIASFGLASGLRSPAIFASADGAAAGAAPPASRLPLRRHHWQARRPVCMPPGQHVASRRQIEAAAVDGTCVAPGRGRCRRVTPRGCQNRYTAPPTRGHAIIAGMDRYERINALHRILKCRALSGDGGSGCRKNWAARAPPSIATWPSCATALMAPVVGDGEAGFRYDAERRRPLRAAGPVAQLGRTARAAGRAATAVAQRRRRAVDARWRRCSSASRSCSSRAGRRPSAGRSSGCG